MCIQRQQFVDPDNINDDLICPIGRGIIDECYGLVCKIRDKQYLHVFCRECITESLRSRSRCPTCRVTQYTNNLVIVPFMNSLTDQLMMVCPNEGCDWKGAMMEIKNHQTVCKYQIVSCSNIGCAFKSTRIEMDDHQVQCLYRIIHCEYCEFQHMLYQSAEIVCPCGQSIPKCTTQQHDKICSHFLLNCVCGESHKRYQYDDHLKKCTHRLIICEFCNIEYKWIQKKNHQPKQCEYCRNSFQTCLMKKHHNICQKMPIKCELCSVNFKRKNKKHHTLHCEQRIVRCFICHSEHKFSESNNHSIIDCQFCKSQQSQCTIEKHLESCSDKIVYCTIRGCNSKFKFKDSQKHYTRNAMQHIVCISNELDKVLDKNQQLIQKN